MNGLLDIDALRRSVDTTIVGRRIECHDELPSTNVAALKHLRDPDCHGLVVLAERQTAGRGRLSRTWHSPKGASVLMSTLLLLEEHTTAARTLLLWSALAACEAIEDSTSVRPAIKWPNDLVVRGRKLSGILIESRPVRDRRAYVVGIGVNCLQHHSHFPPELQGRATSLDIECPAAVDRMAVVNALIRRLDHGLAVAAQHAAPDIKARWAERSVPMGTRLHLESGGRQFSGRVVELDPEAGILIELEQGGRRLFDPYTTSVIAQTA